MGDERNSGKALMQVWRWSQDIHIERFADHQDCDGQK